MSEETKNGLAVQAQGLVKRYNDEVLAVDGVDLTIRENTIYALLGPNGAGKTTMISMLTSLIEPTDGTASVVGYDVGRQADQVRERIGVTFQEMVLDDELTGRQVLDYHGRFYGMGKSERQEKITELLALVEGGRFSESDIDEFRQLLDRLEEDNSARQRSSRRSSRKRKS